MREYQSLLTMPLRKLNHSLSLHYYQNLLVSGLADRLWPQVLTVHRSTKPCPQVVIMHQPLLASDDGAKVWCFCKQDEILRRYDWM